jgi:hypothetical protein
MIARIALVSLLLAASSFAQEPASSAPAALPENLSAEPKDPAAGASAAPAQAATVVAKSADSGEPPRPSAATNPPIKPGQSRCTEASQPGLVVEANTSNGDTFAVVRRVLRITADKRTLVCREFDRNRDGRYDSVRHYDVKGDPSYEEIDSDHDGRIDLWLFFQNGKVGEEQRDTNIDGEPDELITFNEVGQISRVRRDRNFDGKIDEWEIYVNGSLERRGVDDAYEGRVTRWDHDADLVPKEPAAAPVEEKKEEPAAEDPKSKRKKGSKAPAVKAAAPKAASAASAEGGAKPAKKKKK